MFKYLILADQNTFFFINKDISNLFFDKIMPFITNLDHWKIPILIIWIILLIKGGRKGRVAALLLIPVLVMCDQISAAVIKPWVGRIRPCHEFYNINLLVGCGGKLAFPSSHAANISGFGILFSIIYPRFWSGFCLLAIIVGFSRTYVGVHYPGDVLAGFFLGSIISLTFYCIYEIAALKYTQIRIEDTILTK
ncbi:MAG: phosphatase PAP2 family protein [Calditrichota bacterium]|jgi:undecaprenyl-diphosphatase